jgi:hypothetical protein
MKLPRRLSLALAVIVSALIVGAPVGAPVAVAAPAAPTRLSNEEFWKIVTDFSEPDGTFRSDNLVSNETDYPTLMPQLVALAKPGYAYVGVGPEQNFNYIAVLKPDIACIVDIRRGNLDLQLMYKALFELSTNRVDFVSRLFSRPLATNLTTNSSVTDIFNSCEQSAPIQEVYDQNLKAIDDQLAKVHGFNLSSNDFAGVEYVFHSMLTDGPDIRYSMAGIGGRGGRGGRGNFPTYTTLMEASDTNGHVWSYLGNESSFAFLKDFESRNLVVPFIGDFGGPKAVRAVASYLKQKDEIVEAFYVSNVEQYLVQDHIEGNFIDSAGTMPTDASSVFIRASRPVGFGGQFIPGGPARPVLTLHLDLMSTNSPAPTPAAK